MANILIIDDNAIVARAMGGILGRAGHRLLTASTVEEAWKLIHELVKIDLVFSEVRLKSESGLSFLTNLRADPLLKEMPVVMISGAVDQTAVRKALSMRVQNFLIKPFHDADIYNEINKANANPWRNLQFEAEKSFCTQMGFGPAMLKHMREKVIEEIDNLVRLLPNATKETSQKGIADQLDLVLGDAEAAGIWGIVDLANLIKEKIEVNAWSELPDFGVKLEFGQRLIYFQINPDQLPMGFLSDDERREREEAAEHSRWMDANVLKTGPVVSAENIIAKLSVVKNCPVIDSVAASFTIFANGQASNLANIAEVVVKDPGLTAEVLSAVNRLELEDKTTIDDPKMAISMLGEVKLQSMTRSFLTIEERNFQAPPFNWPHFWLFQTAVAHITRFACKQMELHELDHLAYNAGMLHDLGKSLLAHLYPHAIPAIVQHARAHNVTLRTAAARYLDGMSIPDIASVWCRDCGLPTVFTDVIRWVDTPAAATSNKEAVALVALARQLCIENHIGNNGEPATSEHATLAESEAWHVLRDIVFPSFNIATFEAQAHVFIHGLRLELLGKLRLSPEEMPEHNARPATPLRGTSTAGGPNHGALLHSLST